MNEQWKDASKEQPTNRENVLLLIGVHYEVDGKPYIKYYIIEGAYGEDYSSREPRWYNWIGDEFEDKEEVIAWMPRIHNPNWLKEK